jgi:hypothetical protein
MSLVAYRPSVVNAHERLMLGVEVVREAQVLAHLQHAVVGRTGARAARLLWAGRE